MRRLLVALLGTLFFSAGVFAQNADYCDAACMKVKAGILQNEQKARENEQRAKDAAQNRQREQSTSSSGSGGSDPRTAEEQRAATAQWDRFTRWDPGSGYRQSIATNPAPGQGVAGDWQYEVQRVASGEYAYGKITTVAHEQSTQQPVPVAVSCDLRSGGSGQIAGTQFGPLRMDVDHGAVTNGSAPGMISILTSFDGTRLGDGWLEQTWQHGATTSQAREDRQGHLANALQSAISVSSEAFDLVIYDGSRQERGNVMISKAGLDRAFEMLAPCWNPEWLRRN